MAKRTILIFNRGYLPGKKLGGPVTSIQNFCDAFNSEYNIKIVTWDHDFGTQERFPNIRDGWNHIGNADVLYLRDKECTYKRFKEVITIEAPVFCYLSGTITSYFGFNDGVLKACREAKIPVVLAPRGDICNNALSIKKMKKQLAICYCRFFRVFKNVYFQSTLHEETENIKKLFRIDSSHIFEIPNISALIEPNLIVKKKSGVIRLVFVSRITDKKNLADAIRSVNNAKSQVIFDIYGPIENKEYWEKCERIMKAAPPNVQINYKGPLDGEKAKCVFKTYDAFVFETLSENYGHVIIESMLCGCPVILSRGTTPWDDLDGRAGYLGDLGNIESFTKAIDTIAEMKQEEYCALRKSTREYAIRKTDLQHLLIEYRRMFKAIQKENISTN